MFCEDALGAVEKYMYIGKRNEHLLWGHDPKHGYKLATTGQNATCTWWPNYEFICMKFISDSWHQE